jgi:hypothetical protein
MRGALLLLVLLVSSWLSASSPADPAGGIGQHALPHERGRIGGKGKISVFSGSDNGAFRQICTLPKFFAVSKAN